MSKNNNVDTDIQRPTSEMKTFIYKKRCKKMKGNGYKHSLNHCPKENKMSLQLRENVCILYYTLLDSHTTVLWNLKKRWLSLLHCSSKRCFQEKIQGSVSWTALL